MLPHSSVAVHILRMAPWLPPHSVKVPPLLSWKVILIAPAALQLSVAVLCPVAVGATESSQLIVMSGAQVNTGAWSSTTVIFC